MHPEGGEVAAEVAGIGRPVADGLAALGEAIPVHHGARDRTSVAEVVLVVADQATRGNNMKVANLTSAKAILQVTLREARAVGMTLTSGFCFVFLATFGNALLAQKPIPELWGIRVHDEAKVLSQQTTDLLENRLRAFEDSTSNQIAILIVNSLDGEVLEEYSLQVVEKWQLGKKEKDNGVLLLIAVNDHKMRIEVGYGLEGVLTDALCNRIIRNEIAPHFRKDDYEGGVTAGIDAIIKGIGGEYTADGTDDNAMAELGWKEKLLIGAFVFGILGIFTFVGLIAPGCGGWFLYAFLVPFYATFPTILLGVKGGLTLLGVYMVAFPILKLMLRKTPWGERMSKKMGTGSGGRGWSSGSGWSGWSSGGGGGGGFSGGGGSFGGGGSSGSW